MNLQKQKINFSQSLPSSIAVYTQSRRGTAGSGKHLDNY